MHASKFVVILLSTWFAMTTIQAEDVESILLTHQMSGPLIQFGQPVAWNEEFDNPMSLMTSTYKRYIRQSIQIVCQYVGIKSEIVIITFWKKSGNVWTDYSFYFRVPNWSNVDEWQNRFNQSFSKHGTPYVNVQSRYTQPVYSSYINKPKYVEAEQGTSYKTSFELTYEFIYNKNIWSDDLTNSESQQYKRECSKINEDIHNVYALIRLVPNVTHKCNFWFTGVNVRVSVSALIRFDVDCKLNKLNDYDVFRNQFAQYYAYLYNKWSWSQYLNIVIIIHTSPIQCCCCMTTTSMASTTTPAEPSTTTQSGEDERSIVLRHHSTGYAKYYDRLIRWDREYENPFSSESQILINGIKKQVENAVSMLRIKPENLEVVLWKNEHYVGADIAFFFRVLSWQLNDDLQKQIVLRLAAIEKPLYVEELSSTHPIYLSFVRDPIYILGDEDTPYSTSSELTYEFVYNDNEWSEQLLRPDSQEYKQKCWEINEDINEVYAELGVIGMRNHKCVFWQIGDEFRSAVTTLIRFDRNGTFDILDSQKGFRKEFARQYEINLQQLNLCQKLKKVKTIHTTPILYSKPATTTTMTSTTESTTTTRRPCILPTTTTNNPCPEPETTTQDPCLPTKKPWIFQGSASWILHGSGSQSNVITALTLIGAAISIHMRWIL